MIIAIDNILINNFINISNNFNIFAQNRFTMFRILTLLTALCATTFAYANSALPSKISLTVTSSKDVIYKHKFQKNQSVYALAKFFGTEVKQIKLKNPRLDFNSIKVNQQISIPLNAEKIITDRYHMKRDVSYVPVYYVVKKKDNLYRIASTYFNMPVKTLKNNNILQGNAISVGQELLIGWYPYNSSFRDRVLGVDQPIKQTNIIATREDAVSLPKKTETTEVIQTSEPPVEIRELSQDPFELRNKIKAGNYLGKPATYERKIVAQWNKEHEDKTNLYALHATAKIGSFIEIYNPMMRRTVYAKVIGNIPANTYSSEVELIVTPRVADSLGAIDKRFMVRVKYLK